MRYLGLDFETANSSRDSACSVGLCLMDENFNIISEEELLIDPETHFDDFNILIHGIVPEMVVGCPTFPEAMNKIERLINDNTIVVCHNAGFDMSVLRKSCERYNIQPKQFNYVCTYVLTRYLFPGMISYSLDSLVDVFNLPAFQHHNALEDSRSCLHLLHHLISSHSSPDACSLAEEAGCSIGKIMNSSSYVPCKHKRVDSSGFSSFDLSTIEVNPIEHHPFYQKVVVFTGALSSCTRQEAWTRVAKVGGIPADSLSKKTNFLITGYQNPAALNGHEKSSKRIKAEQLLEKGADIQILTEQEFFQIMSEDYS